MDDQRPPGMTTCNATGSMEINLGAAPTDLGPFDVYSREPPEPRRLEITIDASVPDALVAALASRPGSRAVAYSVQLWASACRRNAREGRHPDDDGTVYYCGAWVSREHLRADQRRPWVDRQDPAPGFAPSLGSLMVRPDPPPDPFVGRLVHDHPRERRNARAAERFAAWVAEMEQSSASSNFGLSLGQYEAVRGGRRTVIIAAGPWPETMHVSRELLEHGSLPGFRHDHPTLTIACHRRGAVYEMSYEDQAAMTVCFRLASYWSLERLPGFAEHARAEAAWRGAQG